MGKTFSYEAEGPKGLLEGKKTTLLVASGGVYEPGTAMAALNFVSPYLRTVSLNVQSTQRENCMKIASIAARLLLGVIFVVFGLNGFLHFISGPMPTGTAGQFAGAIFASHFSVVIFGVQAICGLLFLVNRYVPLALVLIGPVIVNIICFHAFMGAPGLPLAILVGVLWAILAIRNKQHLAGIFVQRTE